MKTKQKIVYSEKYIMLSSIMQTIGIHSQTTTDQVVLATTAETIIQEQPQDREEYSAFAQFIGQYGRSYASKDEHSNRFATFRS